MNPDELTSGKTGSAQNLAYRIRNGLCPQTVFGIDLRSEEERQWATKQIAQAANDYDADFFRKLANGIKELKANIPSEKKDPKYFLLRAHSFLKREKKNLPFRNEVIDLARRMWAIARLNGHIPNLPLKDYGSEREILIAIGHLPEQKWSRHFEALGLKFSKAKRGPKPKSK
jgi:hypothetical protein